MLAELEAVWVAGARRAEGDRAFSYVATASHLARVRSSRSERSVVVLGVMRILSVCSNVCDGGGRGDADFGRRNSQVPKVARKLVATRRGKFPQAIPASSAVAATLPTCCPELGDVWPTWASARPSFDQIRSTWALI